MKDFVNAILNPLEAIKRLNYRVRHIEFLLGVKGDPIQTYADSNAAKAGGLEVGEFYKTSDGTIKQVQ